MGGLAGWRGGSGRGDGKVCGWVSQRRFGREVGRITLTRCGFLITDYSRKSQTVSFSGCGRGHW